MEDIVTLLKLD